MQPQGTNNMTTTTKKCVCFWCSPFQVFSPFLFLWATTKIGAKRYVVACYYLVKQWSKSLFKVYFDSCFLGISSTDFVMTISKKTSIYKFIWNYTFIRSFRARLISLDLKGFQPILCCSVAAILPSIYREMRFSCPNDAP